jgi:hypothetical protein
MPNRFRPRHLRAAAFSTVILATLAAACERTEEVPIWNATSGQWERVPVEVKNGRAILGGDVDLGPIQELRGRAQRVPAIPDPDFELWPQGRVPYVVALDFEQRHGALLQDVLRQWESGTGIQFMPRTTETRYMVIVTSSDADTCVTRPYSTPVRIEAQDWCLGHEIGHALGLFHEHQRRDRDRYVDVRTPRIWRRSQYVRFDNLTPCGPYDLASIMHYVDNRIRERPGYPITRQDNVVSEGDRRAVAAIYESRSC